MVKANDRSVDDFALPLVFLTKNKTSVGTIHAQRDNINRTQPPIKVMMVIRFVSESVAILAVFCVMDGN